MKRFKYIPLAIATLFSMYGCNKWMDVNPKTEMKADLLFSTESGFQDALSGVYIQMKSANAYGQDWTFLQMEHLVSSWDVTASSVGSYLNSHNYLATTAETALSNMFAKQYTTIAGINAILDRIDSQKDVFTTPGLYELIKAECLALRAYCHFDILRLFGPVPSQATGAAILPYANKLSHEPFTRLSFNEFKGAVLKDLEDAELLSATIDPLVSYSVREVSTLGNTGNFKPENEYLAHRQFRMNYYAIKALQARAYLWFNENSKALECARKVIEAKNSDGSLKFRLGTSADMAAGDLAFSAEQIFSLYDFQWYTKYSSNFPTGVLKKGTEEASIKMGLYENTGTDIREANWWELITLTNQTKAYTFKKFKVAETSSDIMTDYKRIPMFRLSEMYFIFMETAPYDEANEKWTDFKAARNVSFPGLPTDNTALKTLLTKEFRKEFFGEGQTFFNYKRNNTAKQNFLFMPPSATVNYQVPLPSGEFVL